MYRNYNIAFAIIGSLSFASIKRLHKTWKALPSKYLEIYTTVKELFSIENNYRKYKELIRSQPPPMVPYLGVYLRDLTFLEVGNPTFVDEEEKMINYDKLRMIAKVLIEIQTFKEISYEFVPVQEIQNLLTTKMITFDEEELYEMSLRLEPKLSSSNSAITLNSGNPAPASPPQRKLSLRPGDSPRRDKSSFIQRIKKFT